MPAPQSLPVDVVYPGYHRVSRYDVWQNYAVDRNGYFRPRVIYSPYGPYYRYNGEPFLYSITRQAEFMPYASDQ